MKKAIQQDTLEALVSDAALRECRAVRVEGGWSLQGRSTACGRNVLIFLYLGMTPTTAATPPTSSARAKRLAMASLSIAGSPAASMEIRSSVFMALFTSDHHRQRFQAAMDTYLDRRTGKTGQLSRFLYRTAFQFHMNDGQTLTLGQVL